MKKRNLNFKGRTH